MPYFEKSPHAHSEKTAWKPSLCHKYSCLEKADQNKVCCIVAKGAYFSKALTKLTAVRSVFSARCGEAENIFGANILHETLGLDHVNENMKC